MYIIKLIVSLKCLADTVRRQLGDLGKKIDRVRQLVFTGRKIAKGLKVTETKKPSLINQQCVVKVIRVMRIIWATRTVTSTYAFSVIGKHLKDEYNQRPNNLHEQFAILKKCRGKFERLIYETLLIRKKRPTLNIQTDSISAKVFI